MQTTRGVARVAARRFSSGEQALPVLEGTRAPLCRRRASPLCGARAPRSRGAGPPPELPPPPRRPADQPPPRASPPRPLAPAPPRAAATPAAQQAVAPKKYDVNSDNFEIAPSAGWRSFKNDHYKEVRASPRRPPTGRGCACMQPPTPI